MSHGATVPTMVGSAKNARTAWPNDKVRLTVVSPSGEWWLPFGWTTQQRRQGRLHRYALATAAPAAASD
jgi:hypothetical protein